MIGHYPIAHTTIGGSPIPATESNDEIAFDGFGLQNANVITTEIDFDDTGTIELNQFKYPRENGGGILSKFYRGREIKLKITLKEATGTAFNALLDTFKRSISKTEGFLDLTINGETRRIKATCTRVDFGRKAYNITFANIQVTFTAVEPFFYSKSAQSFQYLGKTATFSEEFTNQGSAAALPDYYFIFGAGSAVTELQITTFGRTLTIANTFASGDVLIVKSSTKSITKNGTEIDYTGQFPEVLPGSAPFTITITGTAAVDATVVVPKNYL